MSLSCWAAFRLVRPQTLTSAGMTDRWGSCCSDSAETSLMHAAGRPSGGWRTTAWSRRCPSAAHRSGTTIWSQRSRPRYPSQTDQPCPWTVGETKQRLGVDFNILIRGCWGYKLETTNHVSQHVQSWVHKMGEFSEQHLPQHPGVTAVSRQVTLEERHQLTGREVLQLIYVRSFSLSLQINPNTSTLTLDKDVSSKYSPVHMHISPKQNYRAHP